jgi:hypothetical protein
MSEAYAHNSRPGQAASVSDASSSAPVRSREIRTADLDGVVNLLRSGFRNQTRDHWLQALKRLSDHPTPTGFPKYGYLLECNGKPVGVSFTYIHRFRLMERPEFDAIFPAGTSSPHLEAMRRCSRHARGSTRM